MPDEYIVRLTLTACKDMRFASFDDCKIGRSSSDESESSVRLGWAGAVGVGGDAGYVLASLCHPLKASPPMESPVKDDSIPTAVGRSSGDSCAGSARKVDAFEGREACPMNEP